MSEKDRLPVKSRGMRNMALAAVEFDDIEGAPRTAIDGDAENGPLRCVLLDDSRFDRRYLCNLAANSRFNIDFVETSTVAEAQAVLHSRDADFVVLDNLLPDGSGVELAREIARDTKLNNLPVILTTGASSEQVAVEALRAGAADYLVKEGLSTETFDQAVENALKRSRAAQADAAAMVSNLKAENATLRRIALRNMRLLKAQTLPLFSFAWRLLSGEPVAREEQTTFSKALSKLTQKVTGLVDDTMIVAATHETYDTPSRVDMARVVRDLVQDEGGQIAASHAHINVGILPVIEARLPQIRMLFEELLLSAIRRRQPSQTVEIQLGADLDTIGNPIIWLTECGVELSIRKRIPGETPNVLLGDDVENVSDQHAWSLCRRLAERNDGEFKVSENNAAGSKVMMRFPKSLLLEPLQKASA